MVTQDILHSFNCQLSRFNAAGFNVEIAVVPHFRIIFILATYVLAEKRPPKSLIVIKIELSSQILAKIQN